MKKEDLKRANDLSTKMAGLDSMLKTIDAIQSIPDRDIVGYAMTLEVSAIGRDREKLYFWFDKKDIADIILPAIRSRCVSELEAANKEFDEI